MCQGFPDSSAGKESICNAGDPSSVPGSGRSAGKGIGLPTSVFLGFPCGSAGKESACSAGDLGWEDPLEKGKVTHSSIVAWRIPQTTQSMGSQSRAQWSDSHFHFLARQDLHRG